MYIYTNEKKLKKNKQISKYTTLGAFAILIAGAVAAFSPKYRPRCFGASAPFPECEALPEGTADMSSIWGTKA